MKRDARKQISQRAPQAEADEALTAGLRMAGLALPETPDRNREQDAKYSGVLLAAQRRREVRGNPAY